MAEIQHSCGFRPFSKTQHITHIALTPGRPSVLVYQHGRLVRLQHMVAVHLFMQVIIEDCRAAVRTLDRPVRHVLSGNRQAVTFKLLFLAVERHRIDIFAERFFMVFFKGTVRVPCAEAVFQACRTGAVLPACANPERAGTV